jgi:hypothetical protein
MKRMFVGECLEGESELCQNCVTSPLKPRANIVICGVSVFSRKGPLLFKTFPPDLSSRLSAPHTPSGCPKQPISVYTFAS